MLVVALICLVLLVLTTVLHYEVLRWLSAGYVELIRGTPLLVQLLILFYVVADAVQLLPAR